VFKYVESEDRLGMLEAMCRWRCCAPTAPDTLCKYQIFIAERFPLFTFLPLFVPPVLFDIVLTIV